MVDYYGVYQGGFQEFRLWLKYGGTDSNAPRRSATGHHVQLRASLGHTDINRRGRGGDRSHP